MPGARRTGDLAAGGNPHGPQNLATRRLSQVRGALVL